MNEFDKTYREIMLEMARPSTLGPATLGPELFERYSELLKKVNDIFKYGVYKYPKLIDFRGEEAYGLNDNVLQDRKLRYFYFCLTKHYKQVDFDDEVSIDHEILRSIMDIKLYSKKLGFYINNAVMITTKSIFSKIKENPQWFLSKQFERALLDPTLMASYMNASREKFHHSSINAAAKREEIGGMGIRDLDKNRSETRDSIRDARYVDKNEHLRSVWKNKNAERAKQVNKKMDKIGNKNIIRKDKIPKKRYT